MTCVTKGLLWLGMPDALDDRTASDGEQPIRVLVVDGHELFRTGLRRLLEDEGLHVVADEGSGERAVRVAAALHPQVVTMDVDMPGMSGIEATSRVLEVSPSTTVVMLTIVDDEEAVLASVLAGASCYLLKDAKPQEIVHGIRAAAAGQSLIAPAVAGGLLTRLRRHGADKPPTGISPLSPREMEVLCLIVAGNDNSDIGRVLHLSTSTVKHHVSSTLEKLNVENRIQAAVLAVRLGLVDDAGSGRDAPRPRAQLAAQPLELAAQPGEAALVLVARKPEQTAPRPTARPRA